MSGINWRQLRLPPPPGQFILRWFDESFPSNLASKFQFRWWVSQRELRDKGELKGFVAGQWGFFLGLIPFFLGAGCLHDNKVVIGAENAKQFQQLVKDGAKGSILADHKGFADTFLIQVGLAVKCGLWKLVTRQILPVMGMMYASRYPLETLLMRAGNFVVAVPPTMVVPKSARKEALAIWIALKQEFPKLLASGFVGLIFAEGTRSRSGAMLQASSGMTELLKHPQSVYLPTAIEGTEKILPPADNHGIPLPIFTQATRIIFGKPLTFEEIDRKAKELQREFSISYRQAFIDVIYREIALLHEKFGDKSYMGHYSRPLEVIYQKKN